MSQTKSRHFSYKKIFSLLDQSNDLFEKKIITKIEDDYISFHKHEFSKFIELLDKKRKDMSKL